MSAQKWQPVLYQIPCIYYTRYPDNGRVAHSAILRMSFAGRFLIERIEKNWNKLKQFETIWTTDLVSNYFNNLKQIET